MLQRALLGLMAMLIQMQVAGAAMEVAQVRGLLQKMQTEEEWGEAVLADGRVRSVLVAEVSQDSVAVVEVVGALQQRGLPTARAGRALAGHNAITKVLHFFKSQSPRLFSRAAPFSCRTSPGSRSRLSRPSLCGT